MSKSTTTPGRRTATLSRRTFLQAAGLSTGSLFLPSLGRAQSALPPKRLVIFFSELGFTPTEFIMRRPGLSSDDDTDTEFSFAGAAESEFSKVLRPLYRHRDELIALENLSSPISILDHYGDGHAQGFCAALTGHPARSEEGFTSHATKPSVDQIIAAYLRAQDPLLTDLASLCFAPSASGSAPGEFGHWPFYTQDAEGRAFKNPADASPHHAFTRLFPYAQGVSQAQAAQPAVLDLVQERYARLAQRLSVDDGRKLSAHRDMIADVQRRLVAVQTCEAPELGNEPPVGNDWSLAWPGIYSWRVERFMDLATVAMHCGLSRVMTFNFKVQPALLFGRSGDVHHDFSHRSDPSWEVQDPAIYADAVGYMSDKMVWEIEAIARFVDRLKAIPEGNGTMMDHTVIYYVNEISHGGHSHENYVALLLAGAAMGFRSGRYLKFGSRFPRPYAQWQQTTAGIGMPNNRLLVSLARSMGMPINQVGASGYVGQISGTEYHFPLTGPLDALT